MTSRFLIYGLIDPRTAGIRYIGQSSTGLKRPRSHSYSVGRTLKAAWLRELRAEGLRYEYRILEELQSAEDLDLTESFWIAQGKSLGWNLTNDTLGGRYGIPGHRQTEQTRALIGAKAKGNTRWLGRHHSPEAIDAQRRAKLGGQLSPEHRAKIAAAGVGHKHTPETRAKMSDARKGRPSPQRGVPRSAETRQRMSDAAKLRYQRQREAAAP